MTYTLKLAIVHCFFAMAVCYSPILPNDTATVEQKVSDENNDDSSSVDARAKLYEKEITAFTTDYKIVCLIDTRVCEKVTSITYYRGKEVLYVRKVVEPAGLITDHFIDYKIAVKR